LTENGRLFPQKSTPLSVPSTPQNGESIPTQKSLSEQQIQSLMTNLSQVAAQVAALTDRVTELSARVALTEKRLPTRLQNFLTIAGTLKTLADPIIQAVTLGQKVRKLNWLQRRLLRLLGVL